MLAAAGIPPGLFASREATGLRESLRQCLHLCISPHARVLESEAREKLQADVKLDFTAIAASDIQGRRDPRRRLLMPDSRLPRRPR